MKVSNLLDLYKRQVTSTSKSTAKELVKPSEVSKNSEAVKVDSALNKGDRTEYVAKLKSDIEAGIYNPSSEDVAKAILYGRDSI